MGRGLVGGRVSCERRVRRFCCRQGVASDHCLLINIFFKILLFSDLSLSDSSDRRHPPLAAALLLSDIRNVDAR